MEQIILKAATTATDEGVFEAVISTATADREKDIVDPAGVVRALHKWNRPVPLAWNHSTKAEDQIGTIDPQSARVEGSEVVVTGHIDQSSTVGADVWRVLKSGALGFSFGFLILEDAPIKGGGRNIREVDVFEVTATTTPMNNDTRVLGYKAMDVEEPEAEVEDADDLRKRADEVAEKHVTDVEAPELIKADKPDLPDGAEWLFPETELKAARAGELKAVWTTAFINSLPDSSFLYVEGGGDKDSEGKTTPRSLRHFPYKDSSGKVDPPHLRNALSRIPQSNLPSDVKDRLTARAQGILNDSKSVDVTGKETESRSVDPLRARADALALRVLSDGESLRTPPRKKEAPKGPEPELELQELKDRMRDVTLRALTGDIEE